MSLGSYAIASTAIASFGDDPVAAPPPVVKTCTRVVQTDAGGRFRVSFELVTCLSGSITLSLGGVDIFSAISTPGVYTEIVTAAVDDAEIVVTGTEDFLGSVDNVSCKRLIWLDKHVLYESVRLDPQPEPDTPTKVVVSYTIPSDTSPNWESDTATYTLPEAAAGEIPLVETQVAMPAVFREEEALIKAQARVLRMKNRVRVSWVTTDRGIAMKRGLVVQVKNPRRGVDITAKLDTVTMIRYGRYRAEGWRYDAEHYPADLPTPEGVGTVPVGFITALKQGASVPSGWAAHSAANGKFIMVADAASASHEPGDTGGSATYAGFSGNTSTDGAHNGSGEEAFETESFTSVVGTGDGYIYEQDNTLVGGHPHSYSTGTVTPNVLRREVVLIQKTGSPGATLPKEALVFGLPGLSLPEITRHTSYKGRLLKAAASNANAGLANQYLTINTGSASNAHDHFNREFITNGSPDDIGFTAPRYDVGSGGGSHLHAITLALRALPKKYRAALYTGTADYDVIPGMWGFWEGSLVSLPTDWHLCDGDNGTPDLRRFFIEIADIGNEGATAHNNTLEIEGETEDDVGHDHDSNYTTVFTHATRTMRHKNTVKHRHDISASASWTPPYYVLAAIMFNP